MYKPSVDVALLVGSRSFSKIDMLDLLAVGFYCPCLIPANLE